MNYRREIDGLRALAVIPVILFHAGFQSFSGGFVGVDIFFVISGYLITSIILTEQRAGKFSLLGFYERRARRILPALFLVMFVCLPFAWLWLLPDAMKSFSESLVAVSGFVSNIFFWSESGYFATAAELKPLLHTWSLGIEEQYYLFFPLFLILLWKYAKGLILPILVIIGFLSLGLSHWASHTHLDASFFLFPTRAWELLIGSCIAFINLQKINTIRDNLRNIALREAPGLVGLALILYAVFVYDNKTPFPGAYALVPTLGAALIVLFSNHKTLVGKLLGSKLFRGLGLISYSAYLWHQPLFAFARYVSLSQLTWYIYCALVTLSLVLAYFSWRYVEQPFRDRSKLTRTRVFTFSAIGMGFFILCGTLGWSTQGFLARYSAEDQKIIKSFVEYKSYIGKRFTDLKLKNFDPGHQKKRIIIIGDSFAQDLVNAIYETKLIKKVDLSVHHIVAECGNLYLKENFTKNIPRKRIASCKSIGWYKSKKLRRLMREADEIWLASSWLYWVAELLPKSVKNIESTFDKKVRVFGTKHFGITKAALLQRELLASPPDRRYLLAKKPKDWLIKVNELMRATLPEDVFINISNFFCDDEYVCNLFTDNHELITCDAYHLTPDGARHYGERLISYFQLQSVFSIQ